MSQQGVRVEGKRSQKAGLTLWCSVESWSLEHLLNIFDVMMRIPVVGVLKFG